MPVRQLFLRCTVIAAVVAGLSLSGASAQTDQKPSWGKDWWDPGSMHRFKWEPGLMGPAQQQRMLRHWAFMNQGVPQQYRGMRNPLPYTKETVAAGAETYAANCSACHGRRGLGDGEAGRDLSPSPALLAYMVQMPMAVDEYLFWAISEGGQPFGTDMPAFKTVLAKNDIWSVISYMRAGFPQHPKNE